MVFSPSFLDELRTRVRLSEVIGRRVSLKQKGRGEFLGLCPFHNEKTPSFTVSDDKQFYHCFGCGAHGDVIRFLVDNQGLSFREAVTQLASEAGLEVPSFTPEDNEKYKKYDSGYNLLEEACSWYEEQLKSSEGQTARDYIERRGLNEDTVKTFRIGYSPQNGNELSKHLISKGHDEEALIETGLVIKKDNGDTFDRFRGRLMFPIRDAKGRVVAFGGRILGEGEPKYLNSPETYLFKKGYLLYNWDLARQQSYDKANIAVVEGYMDTIALYQAGIKNVVAPLGTAITENHLTQLWRVAKEPVLCMDGDNAGRRAMYRAAINYTPLLKPGYSIKFATLPEGQDPDDVIKSSGLKRMREILGSANTLSDTIWESELAHGPIETPEQKADLQQRLMKIVSSIADKSVQEQYRKHFNDKLWQLGFSDSKNSRKQKVTRLTSIDKTASIDESEKQRLETMLFKLLINYPSIMQDSSIENDLIEIDFTKPKYGALRDELLSFAATNADINTENLIQHLEILEFNDEITHIRGCKFLESFAKTGATLEVVKSEWRYVVSLHTLLATQEEYGEALKEFQVDVTEEAQSRLIEMQKQIEVLKTYIDTEKQYHDVLLED